MSTEKIEKYKRAYELLSCSAVPAFYIKADDEQSIPFVVYTVEREFFNADNKNYSCRYIVTAESYHFDDDNTFSDAFENTLDNESIPFEVEEDVERSEHIVVTAYTFEV